MRKRLLATLALVALVALTACGGDGGEADDTATEDTAAAGTLTKEEFIEEGDTLCLALEQAQSQIEPPEDETDFGRYLAEVIGQGEEASRQFAALEAPEDGKDVQAALVDSLNTAIESIKGAQTAAESGDTVTAEDLLRQASEEGNAADEEAQAYGFTECGKDDTDQTGAEKGT
jgi:predicted small lipoprotein YifL